MKLPGSAPVLLSEHACECDLERFDLPLGIRRTQESLGCSFTSPSSALPVSECWRRWRSGEAEGRPRGAGEQPLHPRGLASFTGCGELHAGRELPRAKVGDDRDRCDGVRDSQRPHQLAVSAQPPDTLLHPVEDRLLAPGPEYLAAEFLRKPERQIVE